MAENEIDKMEMIDLVLKILDREDSLINARMTWYLTIQGFIIAGISLLFTSRDKFAEFVIPGTVSLSILAIAISLAVFFAVFRARQVKKTMERYWNTIKNEYGFFPNPIGNTSWYSVFTPGQVVPLLLIVFWVVVITGVCK
ncbi:MAG: hypothetical protein JW913_17755 [Chitinispirillaceae bacterium]|nr:hypothetical protein [Chitinispirillaceae bacterium]